MRFLFDNQKIFNYSKIKYFKSKLEFDNGLDLNQISEVHIDETTFNNTLQPTLNDLCTNDYYNNFGFFTMLRNPVKRSICEFHWGLNLAKNYGFKFKGIENQDITTWIHDKSSFNLQTKFLLGIGHLADYEITEDDYNRLINKIDSYYQYNIMLIKTSIK